MFTVCFWLVTHISGNDLNIVVFMLSFVASVLNLYVLEMLSYAFELISYRGTWLDIFHILRWSANEK